MSISAKYTVEERKIARNIHQLENRKRYFYRRWHEIDIQVNAFKKKLKGKYGGWKKNG